MCDVNSQEMFLAAFFCEMNDGNVEYAVLHKWQELPCKSDSDVDMVIGNAWLKRVPDILSKVERKTGWRVVQRLWYDVPRCYYYVAVSPDTRVSVALDFLADESGIGEYRIKGSLLLEDCVLSNGIRHMSCESEVAYKLAKRRMKGIFKSADMDFLKEYLSLCNSTKLTERLYAYLPSRFANRIETMLATMPDLSEWAKVMASDRPKIRLPGMKWTLHGHPAWWVFMICRTISRLRNESGCVVYLKSEVANTDGSEWDFGFVFRKVRFIGANELSYAKKREAFLKAWLLVVQNSGRVAVECKAGRLKDVEGCQDLRETIVNELHSRYTRRFR